MSTPNPFTFNLGDKVINGYDRAGQVMQQSAFDWPAENSYFVTELETQESRWWNQSDLTLTTVA